MFACLMYILYTVIGSSTSETSPLNFPLASPDHQLGGECTTRYGYENDQHRVPTNSIFIGLIVLFPGNDDENTVECIAASMRMNARAPFIPMQTSNPVHQRKLYFFFYWFHDYPKILNIWSYDHVLISYRVWTRAEAQNSSKNVMVILYWIKIYRITYRSHIGFMTVLLNKSTRNEKNKWFLSKRNAVKYIYHNIYI